jgi:hypothetical protein
MAGCEAQGHLSTIWGATQHGHEARPVQPQAGWGAAISGATQQPQVGCAHNCEHNGATLAAARSIKAKTQASAENAAACRHLANAAAGGGDGLAGANVAAARRLGVDELGSDELLAARAHREGDASAGLLLCERMRASAPRRPNTPQATPHATAARKIKRTSAMATSGCVCVRGGEAERH